MIYRFGKVVVSRSGCSQERIRSTIIALVLLPALAITALSAAPSRSAAQVVFERPEGLRGMLRDLFQFSLDPSSRDPNGPAGVQLAGRGFAASTVSSSWSARSRGTSPISRSPARTRPSAFGSTVAPP